jgi:hypothetical protein
MLRATWVAFFVKLKPMDSRWGFGRPVSKGAMSEISALLVPTGSMGGEGLDLIMVVCP